MNIKLSREEIRFRIRHDEMQKLIEHKTLEEETRFPKSGKISYCIKTTEKFNFIKLTKCTNQIVLEISRNKLLNLRRKLPSKEGITGKTTNGLNYALEVDLYS